MHGPIICRIRCVPKPLSQEFGWSRTGISLAFSLVTDVSGPAAHRRLVIAWGAQGDPASVLLLAWRNVFLFPLASLWHFYASTLLLGREQRDFAGLLQGDLLLVCPEARLGFWVWPWPVAVGTLIAAPLAKPHCHGGWPMPIVLGSGHRDYHASGRVVSEGDAAADGVMA